MYAHGTFVLYATISCFNSNLLAETFVVSADNLCKQFGRISGPKLFYTLIVFLKYFFEKVNFEKCHKDDNKSMKNYPAYLELSQMTIF